MQANKYKFVCFEQEEALCSERKRRLEKRRRRERRLMTVSTCKKLLVQNRIYLKT